MKFEWDPRKADSNLKKHRISFNEATTVFGDPLSETFFDPDHSLGEERYITLGLSYQKRVLVISHTDRGDIIRIISVRKATQSERNFYEEGE